MLCLTDEMEITHSSLRKDDFKEDLFIVCSKYIFDAYKCVFDSLFAFLVLCRKGISLLQL